MAAGEAVAGSPAVFTEVFAGLLSSCRQSLEWRRWATGFIGRQRLPFAAHSFQNRQFAPNGVPFNGFSTGFPNSVPTQFPTGFPWWRNGWGGWVTGAGRWAVGWPGDWGSGGYYGYAYPPLAQAPAPEPQVIVINSDGQGRVTTAETPADYSYVKGCHAIPTAIAATHRLRPLRLTQRVAISLLATLSHAPVR